MKEEKKYWAVVIILWSLCVFIGGIFAKYILQYQTPQDNYLFGSGISAISLFLIFTYLTYLQKHKNIGRHDD